MTLANGTRLSALLAPLALALVAGCQSLPEPPGRNVQELYHGTLEEVRPMDVVVAPVVDLSVDGKIPELELRQAFQRQLIKRRYSALALPYTDRRVVNASYTAGTLEEDAVMQITVREWDLSRWESHSEVAVKVEAWMHDSRDDTELWGGILERTFYLQKEVRNRPTRKGLMGDVAAEIAEELLEVMPARTPQP